MQVMMVSKHPAHLCPVHEPKYREQTIRWYEEIESVAAKYGVKFIGSWDDHPGHVVYVLYETPSMDNLMGMMMDPVAAAPLQFCNARVFPVFDHQTTLGIIKQSSV